MSKTAIARVRAALPWLAAVAFVVAGVLVARTVARLGKDAIVTALASLDTARVARSASCTAASYLVLTLVDWLALRSATRRRLPYPVVALASFTAISLGHVAGLPFLSSSMVRYRIYSHFGLDEADVARVLVFAGMTIALGLAGLASLACVGRPETVAEFAGVPTAAARALGIAALLALAAYVAWTARAAPPVRLFRFRLPRPTPRVALAQIGVGTLNYFCVAAALHALLGDALDVSLFTFASFYAVAHALGILSHVPGGLGVLEVVVLSAAPGADAVSALIVFRIVYHLAPFLLGALLYGAYELHRGTRARRTRDADAR